MKRLIFLASEMRGNEIAKIKKEIDKFTKDEVLLITSSKFKSSFAVDVN